MSTIINTNGLPDTEALEKLANELFSAFPGQTINTDISSIHTYTPQISDNAVPKSVAGSGISPSAVDQDTQFNISDPQTSLPDPHFAGNGVVPKSLAGSGVSPSAYKNGPEQNVGYKSYLDQLNRPEKTSPFQKTEVPASWSDLPFASLQFNDPSLKEVLSSISTYMPSQQLPFAGNTQFPESSFYFLPEKELSFFSKEKSLLASSFSGAGFDANLIKRDFPILSERVNGKPLIWLDNAATTQKPKQVIERISYFYEHENSNIHRAAHELAARATDAYEEARKKVQLFLNAGSINEIVFVRGATEAINLVAKSWGEQNLQPGDEIIVSHLEHHANIVPWQ